MLCAPHHLHSPTPNWGESILAFGCEIDCFFFLFVSASPCSQYDVVVLAPVSMRGGKAALRSHGPIANGERRIRGKELCSLNL